MDELGIDRLDDREWRPQRLELIGALAGNVAHDFNNLLTIICCHVATVLESLPSDDLGRRHLVEVQQAADHAAELTRDLLAFSRKAGARVIRCDLSQVVAEAVRLMRHALPVDVMFETELAAAPLPLLGDPTALHQVLLNLCFNARAALPMGGSLTVRTYARHIDEPRVFVDPASRAGDFAVLALECTAGSAVGASGHRRARAAPAGGSPVLRQIVRAHQGWMDTQALSGGGTRVEVYFPLEAEKPSDVRHAVDPAALSGSGTVLIADDQPMIVALLRTVLEARGYQTLTAETGGEAVAALAAGRDAVVAAVLDRNLPRVDANPVFDHLRRIRPDFPIVLISGSLPTGTEAPLPTDARTRFVGKPFSPNDVLEALHAVLA
jgi:two-component system, cell cycle sensor histidine kinase and response regulator CckA